MKKLYIVLLFIISVLVAFFVTKSISGDKNPVSENPETIPVTVESPETTMTIDVPIDTPVVPDPPIPDPTPGPNPPRPKPIADTTKKHVKITFAEVKNLIMSGKYTRDKRISDDYRIDYVDVSDDDLTAGLQQNLQYVQDRVAYGEDGDGWRGFEVVGLDYDSKGLVNRIEIRPIY